MKNPVKPYVVEDAWRQKRKNKILIVGGLAVVIVSSVLLYKNKDIVSDLMMTARRKWQKAVPRPVETHGKLQDTEIVSNNLIPVREVTKISDAIQVKGHIRNLPPSQIPSHLQRTIAETMGISLGDHQTYVRNYMKKTSLVRRNLNEMSTMW